MLAHLTPENGVVAEFLFDTEELIVFRHAIGAAEGTGLDLARIRSHGDVGDGDVFGFARAVADDSRVAVFLGQFDGVECFRECADLVHLHQDRVGNTLVDSLLEEIHVGHKKIVADELSR